jgi:nucleoside-diphosphate-sugar epimerase
LADRRVVLVTGATGFLGRWSVAPLLARGYEVHACGTHALPADALPAELAGAAYHRVNVLNAAEAEACLQAIKPSHLLHFAWNATPGSYWTDLDNYDWLAAGLHLARRFHHHGGTRLVVAGTCAEYDWSVAARCKEGETPTVLGSATPALPYAVCKAALQQALDSFGRQSGLSVGWGRIFFQFGPYESPRRLVPAIITALLAGKPALCSHGRQQRSFLYSPDIGSAFAALVDSALAGPVNIGADEVTTIGQLAQRIGALMGRPELIQLGAREAPAGEPSLLVPDGARMRGELGWQPRVSLDEGLQRTIAWWRDAGSVA